MLDWLLGRGATDKTDADWDEDKRQERARVERNADLRRQEQEQWERMSPQQRKDYLNKCEDRGRGRSNGR